MSNIHTRIGFELGNVKHYASPEAAKHFVEKNLANFIKAGVMFNILIVEQRRGGMGADAEDRRYIPIIHAIRCPKNYVPELTVGGMIARMGYTVFG